VLLVVERGDFIAWVYKDEVGGLSEQEATKEIISVRQVYPDVVHTNG